MSKDITLSIFLYIRIQIKLNYIFYQMPAPMTKQSSISRNHRIKKTILSSEQKLIQT